MERLIRRLLLIWLAVLAGLLLSPQLAPKLSHSLLVAVAAGSPVVAALLLWRVVLGLREVGHRCRVMRRAGKWRRAKPENKRWWMEAEE